MGVSFPDSAESPSPRKVINSLVFAGISNGILQGIVYLGCPLVPLVSGLPFLKISWQSGEPHSISIREPA